MITGYFGVPGCGKTTFATKKAQKALKRLKKGRGPYKHVLTNFECKGCEKIDFSNIGIFDIQDSLIILDELTIDADNRDFKNFTKSSVEGFVYHRHDKNDIIYFTQQYDAVDKKIRNLTARLYYIKQSYVLPISKARQIFREYKINDYTGDLLMGYRFAVFKEIFLDFVFFNHKVGRVVETCFRPRWFSYFDSFSRPYASHRLAWSPQKWDDILVSSDKIS